MKDKVRTVMKEFKRGDLKSSSGRKVTNPKQAIAIALSEAGKSKKGSGMKKMAAGGRMASKGEHSVQTKSKRGAEMVKMAMGGKVKKMASGGSCSYKKDADGVAKKGLTKPKMMRKGGKTC